MGNSNNIMDRLKKSSKIKDSEVLADSVYFNHDRESEVSTIIPMINVALSGRLDGGLTSGLTIFAGPSKHFKTMYSLLMASAYLKKYPESALLFYDSEFGSPQGYFESFDIDTNRVLHAPITDIEELKFDLMNQLKEMEKKDRVIIVIDSIGNLASKKEMEDALNEKSVADMTRAKAIKSLFRMVTPFLTTKDVPLIAVNHTYQTQEMFSKAVVSGGCVVKGTEIQTPNGLKKVEDFKVGDTVNTLSGKQKVTHTWNPDTLENGMPECYEIEFEDGYKVICSNKHKFLIDGKWIETKDLTPDIDCTTLSKDVKMKIKSITNVGKIPVYDLSVEEVEHYVLKNGVVTHNTGIYYAANTIWIIGRRQDKQGTEIQGYHFVINVEKSRFVKEKSQIPISVSWDGGIQKYSGLLEIALEGGFVVKPSNGWYSKVDLETGEPVGTKYREKDTHTSEFWNDILSNERFYDFVKNKYMVPHLNLMNNEEK